jgi:serine/threonine-protein kinase
LAFVLVSGSIVVTCLWLLADQRRRLAEVNLIESNHQRERAETNLRLARQAVDDSFIKVSEDERLLENFRQLRKELLQTALPYYEKFVEQDSDDPEVRAELGRAWLRLGFITKEIDDQNKAIIYHEKALAIFAQLVRDDPAKIDYQRDLAVCHNDLGNLYSAIGKSPEAEQPRSVMTWASCTVTPGRQRKRRGFARRPSTVSSA